MVKNNVSSTKIWEIHLSRISTSLSLIFLLSDREKTEWQRPLKIWLIVIIVIAWVRETSSDPNIYALNLMDTSSKVSTPTAFVILHFEKYSHTTSFSCEVSNIQNSKTWLVIRVKLKAEWFSHGRHVTYIP